MEIHFLGTGSAFPSPKRCSSCTALRLESGAVWIFDCGEGGQIQIQKSKLRAGKIRAVFITHLHGDHLFGLPGMMCTISQAVENQHLDVYGPQGLKNFLRSSLALSFSNLSYTFTVHEIRIQDIQGTSFCFIFFTVINSFDCLFCKKKHFILLNSVSKFDFLSFRLVFYSTYPMNLQTDVYTIFFYCRV